MTDIDEVNSAVSEIHENLIKVEKKCLNVFKRNELRQRMTHIQKVSYIMYQLDNLWLLLSSYLYNKGGFNYDVIEGTTDNEGSFNYDVIRKNEG